MASQDPCFPVGVSFGAPFGHARRHACRYGEREVPVDKFDGA